MEIYLVRHTKTDTPTGLCYGQTDVPLADSFPKEAAEIKKKLSGVVDAARIYSSPLQRCLQLAHLFGKPVKQDERLLEIAFGEWENRRFNELDTDALVYWTEHFVTVSPPLGESFGDLCVRVAQFWDGLLKAPQNETAVIITHAGVIRALLSNILQLPPANAFKFRIDTGSVCKLRYENQYVYIDYLNR